MTDRSVLERIISEEARGKVLQCDLKAHAIVDYGLRLCVLHQIGGTAVSLAGGDERTLEPGGCFVENCHIHHFAYLQKVFVSAVDLSGVGQTMRHCLVHNGPHGSVWIRGNDPLVEFNDIHHVIEMFQDVGAIGYFNMWDPQYRGTVVRRNFLHHIGLTGRDMQVGVYADWAPMGLTVEENVFYKIGTPEGKWCWGVMNHGGSYVHTRHNVFVDCVNPFTISFFLNNWGRGVVPRMQEHWKRIFAENDFASMPHAKRYPELLRFFDEDRIVPTTSTFMGNLIYNPGVPRVYEGAFQVMYGPQEALKARDNWVADQDPGFVDAARMDLRPDAPVFEKIPGFPRIPFDQVGLRGPVGPHAAE